MTVADFGFHVHALSYVLPKSFRLHLYLAFHLSTLSVLMKVIAVRTKLDIYVFFKVCVQYTLLVNNALVIA